MKNQFRAYCAKFGMTAHYSGHTNTMYVRSCNPTLGLTALNVADNKAKWGFNVVAE